MSVSKLMRGIFGSKLTSHRPGMWQQSLCLHQWCKHICPVSWIRVHIAELLLRTAHSMCLCLCLSSGTLWTNKKYLFFCVSPYVHMLRWSSLMTIINVAMFQCFGEWHTPVNNYLPHCRLRFTSGKKKSWTFPELSLANCCQSLVSLYLGLKV